MGLEEAKKRLLEICEKLDTDYKELSVVASDFIVKEKELQSLLFLQMYDQIIKEKGDAEKVISKVMPLFTIILTHYFVEGYLLGWQHSKDAKE